jgi:hypothetical protein
MRQHYSKPSPENERAANVYRQTARSIHNRSLTLNDFMSKGVSKSVSKTKGEHSYSP